MHEIDADLYRPLVRCECRSVAPPCGCPYSQSVKQRRIFGAVPSEILRRRARRQRDGFVALLRDFPCECRQSLVVHDARITAADRDFGLHAVPGVDVRGDDLDAAVDDAAFAFVERAQRPLHVDLVGHDVRRASGLHAADREHALFVVERHEPRHELRGSRHRILELRAHGPVTARPVHREAQFVACGHVFPGPEPEGPDLQLGFDVLADDGPHVVALERLFGQHQRGSARVALLARLEQQFDGGIGVDELGLAGLEQASRTKQRRRVHIVTASVHAAVGGCKGLAGFLGNGQGVHVATKHDDRTGLLIRADAIALGRGGDQAAVKTVDGFEFFGGISHGVEKRSHVRSRIIANALADQIRQSDSVIIMGHRQSDLDAIGSAIGLLRMCKMCDVPSVIAVRSKATLAGQLLDVFNKAGEDHNFIEPEETYKLITPKTLLIVTDTYQKRLLEDQKIYEKCSRVVVIDHHRMAVGHIDNPILLYHEPFASSASELVCELLQFMPAQNNITQLEAQALLSGIMLDTRSFALHVGVRTFEAAAWLRSRGAETAATKRLFNISKEEYEARAAIVEGAYLYKGCAIATSDELDPAMSVVLPMALNVQVILEPLGGGGHLTMAGAQLRDCTVKEAEARIRAQIDEYRANQECQEELVGAV